MEQNRYDNIAIALHWIIALAIIFQLASGFWMVDAIRMPESQKIAYGVYQYHKSFGLIVLTLSLFRLYWRFFHKPPALPQHMAKWEIIAAHASHAALYFFMIAIPLAGWALVSTSSFGLPTMIFGLLEWPHISFLTDLANKNELNKFFSISHKYMATGLFFLLILHILAAIKHQILDKDNLFKRILP